MSIFTNWKAQAIGRKINVDHAYGDQCVDVIMDYAQYLFHKPWYSTIGHGNAKDIFWAASNSYFTKIVNNPHLPNQIPIQGDVIVYGAFRGNPYGHIAAVDRSSRAGTDVIEQDGFNPSGKAYEKFRNYTNLPVIGWLRPKTGLVAKIVQVIRPRPVVRPVTYIVHAGDNLTVIARKFGTTVQNLAKLNNIKNINLIRIGQNLRIR